MLFVETGVVVEVVVTVVIGAVVTVVSLALTDTVGVMHLAWQKLRNGISNPIAVNEDILMLAVGKKER